jgi:hypothetical protein
VPITFPARPVISEALDRNTDRIVEELGDAVDTAAGASAGGAKNLAARAAWTSPAGAALPAG